jgi:hypothetical protein
MGNIVSTDSPPTSEPLVPSQTNVQLNENTIISSLTQTPGNTSSKWHDDYLKVNDQIVGHGAFGQVV